jgi:hypothetical protein
LLSCDALWHYIRGTAANRDRGYKHPDSLKLTFSNLLIFGKRI